MKKFAWKVIPFVSLFLFTALSAFAIPEADQAQVKELLDQPRGRYTIQSFTGTASAKVAYVKYGQEAGSRGCLVVAPGRGESSLRYVEVAHDLNALGFSPIYTIDHRGQGLSARLLDDKRKQHVEDFYDYSRDLEIFVNRIVLNDSACRGHKMYLMAHSMGGAISTAYLEKVGNASPFRSAAFVTPMMKIAFEGKTESSVIFQTWMACHSPIGPACRDFAPGTGPYDPNAPFANNGLTSSEARFDLMKYIAKKFPDSQVGGPTVRWVHEAASADQSIRKSLNAGRIALPMLILQGGKDTVVDNAGQDEICGFVRNCRISKLPTAQHSVLSERDAIRDQALKTIVSFFESN
ncbi:MAG TPA: alpha/beta fold hydrolase [Bdellovibrionota bacterium]|jgi:lysophospholipase